MLRKTVFATLLTLPALAAHAAALERSDQSTAFMFEPGNRVELGAAYVAPSVKGQALDTPMFIGSGGTVANYDIPTGDVGNNYMQYAVSGKFQLNDQLSLGLKYEQPFGINVRYNNDSGRYQAVGAPDSATAGMNAKAQAHNFTALVAYKTPQNISIFGGPTYQSVNGSVALPALAGYDLDLPGSGGWGYVLGAAYEKPDIALRATLTYRSAVKYAHKVTETFNHPQAGAISQTSDLNFKLPQSVNLEFQTGIAPKTLLLASARWTDWSAFKVRPDLYTSLQQANGVNTAELVSFGKDSYQFNLGVGRQLSEKFSGYVIGGYDSGNGDPVSPLGPPDKAYTLNVGGKYVINKHVDIGAGVQYNWYKNQSTTVDGVPVAAAKFNNMNVWGVGARLGVSW